MFELPKQFKNKGFSFVKLAKESKIPDEKWGLKDTNDKEIEDWVNNGNNYGIKTINNELLVVDIDDSLLHEKIRDHLPETYCEIW